MNLAEHHKAIKKINLERKKIRLKFDLLYEKKKNILITKKKNILNQIKSRSENVVSAPTSLRQLYKKDFLYIEYKEINNKIKKLRSKIDLLFIKKTDPLTNEREKIIKEIKLLTGSKTPKKKIRHKKKPRARGDSKRSSQLKPANVKGSFQLLRTINFKPSPINRLAASVTGFRSKKNK